MDRLVSQHEDILRKEDFQTLQGGARLLGRDMNQVMNHDTSLHIIKILEDEVLQTGNFKLISHISASTTVSFDLKSLRFNNPVAV